MDVLERVFSLASLISLFILGPAFGRALLLWWDKRRERSLPSQHVALAVCTKPTKAWRTTNATSQATG